jgi:hypothetical protein
LKKKIKKFGQASKNISIFEGGWVGIDFSLLYLPSDIPLDGIIDWII